VTGLLAIILECNHFAIQMSISNLIIIMSKEKGVSTLAGMFLLLWRKNGFKILL